MEKVTLGIVILCVAVAVFAVAAPYVGPLTSGALFLLSPAPNSRSAHDLATAYTPRHKGHISVGTGLYIRDDEDLIVRGTPALILRRTYRSEYQIQREFGVGTTHNAGAFIEGDVAEFRWAQIVMPDGVRIRFDRISSGNSYSNALFEHRTSPSDWQGARLGWTGSSWAVRKTDGTLMIFQSCGGAGEPKMCSLLSERDGDGHRIDYKRDANGRLLRMEATPDRWIAFDYDDQDRITRAYDKTRQEVRYAYDDRGRLLRVISSDGRTDQYTYTERDEMATIDAPEMRLENSYEDGRCIRQVDRFPDDPEPLTFQLTYEMDGDNVRRSDVRRSDGSWTRYVYGGARYIVEESWGSNGFQPLTFKYDRDSVSSVITSVTLTCPDRKGRLTTHQAAEVRPESEEWTKWDLVRTLCTWRSEGWRSVE